VWSAKTRLKVNSHFIINNLIQKFSKSLRFLQYKPNIAEVASDGTLLSHNLLSVDADLYFYRCFTHK